MSVFRFRLQQVLELREQTEKQAAAKLAEAETAADEARVAKKVLEDIQHSGAQALRTAHVSGGGPTIGQLKTIGYVIEQLNHHIVDAQTRVESAEQTVSETRTDLNSALQARRVATEHLRRDDWVYYAPTLLGQAQAFRQTQTALQPGSGWQATLVLSIPFFDGGFRYGVQRERDATDQEARAQLDGLLRQVSVEVRSAFAVVRNADESLQAARSAVTAATTAASLADKSYRAGASTNIEVIDAERQARDAESQAALGEDAARQARLDLLVATGAFP